VEELAHPEVERLDGELRPLAVTPRPHGGAVDRGEALPQVRHRAGHLPGHRLDVDVGLPRQVVGVPLPDLGLLVELLERRAGAVVVPGEDGVAADRLGVHEVAEVDGVVGEDRLHVVDVGPAEERAAVVGHERLRGRWR